MLCQKKEIEDIINGQEVDEGNSYTCTVTGKWVKKKSYIHREKKCDVMLLLDLNNLSWQRRPLA